MILTPLVIVVVRKVALSLLFIASGVMAVAAQEFPHHVDPIEVALTAYIATLRTVTVTIANETVPFLLDTGGGFTVLTPEVAYVAGCVSFGRVTGFRTPTAIRLHRCT